MAAVQIFSASWPNQNNNEWDASSAGARGEFTWPVGRSTRCMDAGIIGGGAGKWAYVTDNFGALTTGANWHGRYYFKVFDENITTADIMVLSLENAASGEGIYVKVDTAESGGNYRLWMGNSDAVGAYSTYSIPGNTWKKIDAYVHLSADAGVGKIALLIADVEKVLDADIKTMVNGDLNRLRLGADALAEAIGTGAKYLNVRFDDTVHYHSDPYSAWMDAGGHPRTQGANLSAGVHLIGGGGLLA